MYIAHATAHSAERLSYFEYGKTGQNYYMVEYRDRSIRNYSKAYLYEDFAHLASLNEDILNSLDWTAA